MNSGILYIVATPIGNLADISQRALTTLQDVDLIAAEDTRHSATLLGHYGITNSTISLHEHNEQQQIGKLLQYLSQGKNIALISDAGTPLISDPGMPLVREVQNAGYRVIPIPGAVAFVAALSVSGLPTDRFVFEGFLPNKTQARQAHLESVQDETRTLIFYEAPHRLLATLQDMVTVFGDEREVVLAREITKHFETIRRAPVAELQAWVESDANQQKGECVLLVHGAAKKSAEIDAEALRILKLMLTELPVKQAASLTAQISGLKKNALYQYALKNLLNDE